MNKMHQYNYLCFSDNKHGNNCLLSDQKWKSSFSNRRKLKSSYIPFDEYGFRAMVSIIFIHLGFWMGPQQPSVPEGSLQGLVPSGHCCFSSGEKTLPEMPMKPFLLNSVFTCCRGLQQYQKIWSWQQYWTSEKHILPSGHLTCNKE